MLSLNYAVSVPGFRASQSTKSHVLNITKCKGCYNTALEYFDMSGIKDDYKYYRSFYFHGFEFNIILSLFASKHTIKGPTKVFKIVIR